MGRRLAVLVDGGWDADELESSAGRAGPDVGGGRVALDLALATAIAGSHHCKGSVSLSCTSGCMYECMEV